MRRMGARPHVFKYGVGIAPQAQGGLPATMPLSFVSGAMRLRHLLGAFSSFPAHRVGRGCGGKGFRVSPACVERHEVAPSFWCVLMALGALGGTGGVGEGALGASPTYLSN